MKTVADGGLHGAPGARRPPKEGRKNIGKTEGGMVNCTGMAGEFLTVGKLFKRGYQASVTLGSAKAVDVFVYNPETDKSFNVQVKTSQAKELFSGSQGVRINRHAHLCIHHTEWVGQARRLLHRAWS